MMWVVVQQQCLAYRSEWENVSCRTNDKSKIVSLSEKRNNNMLRYVGAVIKPVTEKKRCASRHNLLVILFTTFSLT